MVQNRYLWLRVCTKQFIPKSKPPYFTLDKTRVFSFNLTASEKSLISSEEYMDKLAELLHERSFLEDELVHLLQKMEENQRSILAKRTDLKQNLGEEATKREIEITEVLLGRENKLPEPNKVDPENYRAWLRFLLVQKITSGMPWVSTVLAFIHAQITEIRETRENSR